MNNKNRKEVMNMKKSLLIGMTVLSVGAMMGCSGTNQTDQKQDVETNQVVAPEKPPVEEKEVSLTSHFGKVEKVIGNEISLKLAKQPTIVGSETGEEINLDDFEITYSTNPDGNIVGQVGSISGAVSGGGIQPGESITISGEDLESFISTEGKYSNLDYLGESKSMTIPAGVEIFNSATGKEGKLTDIKEGSILTVYMDEETSTVSRIEIME